MAASPIRWSHRDEHRMVSVLLVSAAGSALVLRAVPPGLDLYHRIGHGLGFMAPTCGLTRAGLALVRGDLSAAWRYNPAILLIATLAVVVLTRLAVGFVSGRWLTLSWVPGRWLCAGFVFLALGLWINQQAHFDFLVS